jgi:F-type H+-transporting ATPase subunit a
MEIDVFHLFLWEPIAFEGTPFAINRVVLLMFLAAAITIGFFLLGARKKALVPKGIQFVAEEGYMFVRNKIAIDVIGPEGVKYAPFLATLFFFIFFLNLLEIVPGVSFPVTSRLALPAIMAIITYVVFNVVGIMKQGLGGYLKGTLFPPGVPGWIKPLLAIVELLSVFIIRPLTLTLRLFANMLAGHVLLTIFFLFTEELIFHGDPIQWPLGVLTFIVAAGLIVFEFFVISIQAYIFTVLTAFYIAESIHGHGEEEHDEKEATQRPEAIRETELASA